MHIIFDVGNADIVADRDKPLKREGVEDRKITPLCLCKHFSHFLEKENLSDYIYDHSSINMVYVNV